MASGNITMSAQRLARRMTMTMRITGAHRFTFRFWLARRVIAVAAWLMPVDTKVVWDESPDEIRGED